MAHSLSSTLSWSGLQRKQKATCQTVWHFLGPRRQPSYSQTLPPFLSSTSRNSPWPKHNPDRIPQKFQQCCNSLTPAPTSAPPSASRADGERRPGDSAHRLRHTHRGFSPSSTACWPFNLRTFPSHAQCLPTLCNQG